LITGGSITITFTFRGMRSRRRESDHLTRGVLAGGIGPEKGVATYPATLDIVHDPALDSSSIGKKAS
jgi:hypothetical protein